jgi:hypothetical protein
VKEGYTLCRGRETAIFSAAAEKRKLLHVPVSTFWQFGRRFGPGNSDFMISYVPEPVFLASTRFLPFSPFWPPYQYFIDAFGQITVIPLNPKSRDTFSRRAPVFTVSRRAPVFNVLAPYQYFIDAFGQMTVIPLNPKSRDTFSRRSPVFTVFRRAPVFTVLATVS